MGVVGDDGPVPNEVHEHLHGLLLQGRVLHVAVPDAGELGYVRGNVPLRIYKGVEDLPDLPAGEDHRADLRHPVVQGVEAGRLNVKGHKLRVQGQLALADDGAVAVHVVYKIALQAVDDLDPVLFPRLPHVREGLGHAVVRDGDGGHAPVGGPLDDGRRVRQRVQRRKAGMHVQLHPLFRGLVGPYVALALHDASGVQHHVVVILAVNDLALDHHMVALGNLVDHRLVVLGAEEAGDADGVGPVRHVEAEHRAAPLLEPAAGDGHHVPLDGDLARFQRDGVHGHGPLPYGPAKEHISLGRRAGAAWRGMHRRGGGGHSGPGKIGDEPRAAEAVVGLEALGEPRHLHGRGHGGKPGADRKGHFRRVHLHIRHIGLFKASGVIFQILAAGKDAEEGAVLAHGRPSFSISATRASQRRS